MVTKVVRVFFAEIASRFGWFLLLVGLILPGFQVFDHLTTRQAVATVVDIQPLCQKEICKLGKCRWRKIRCETMAEVEAAGTNVRSRPYAKLAFTDSRGRARKAWTSFSKLEIKSAEVGDHFTIVYRGNKRPYVAPPFSWQLAGLGFGISLAGLVLVMLARALRRPPQPAQPMPVPPPVGARQEQARYAPRKPAAAPTPVDVASTKARRADAPARQRGGAVQRDRGLLERMFG